MSLLKRLKEARIVRVLLVYLGASWVVIEASALLREELGLPDWVVPVTLILVLVGAVVVVATAWVQAQPATDRREAAGEVPSDWELDLGDLVGSIRRGKLPHLTWGRAIGGGVIAFLALFGLASLLMPGDDGPERLVIDSDSAAPALAVLPFRATGTELDAWREGLVDLLSRNLDGLGGLRAIDSRTVLARWAETVGDTDQPDLATALSVAGRTGARWALLGAAVEVGPSVRVTADIYEVDTGRRVDAATAEGPPDSLLALVDGLSVDVARALLELEDSDLSALRLSSITTASPEALRRFLEGEAAYRRLAFGEAAEAYLGALALDSTFALAHYRLASARGWQGTGGPAERQKAYAYRDRLPEREALMVEADYRARNGALPSGVALLREGVRRYPDDPEIHYQLGDVYVHYGPQLLVLPDQARRELDRAVALDPGFAPYNIHRVDFTLLAGDSAAAARQLHEQAELAGPNSREVRAQQILFDYLYGPPEAREAALAAVDTAAEPVRAWLSVPIALTGERAGDALVLANATCDGEFTDPTTPPNKLFGCFWTHAAAGRIDAFREASDALRRHGVPMVFYMDFVMRQTGLDPDAPRVDPELFFSGGVGSTDGVADLAVSMAGLLALEAGRTALADSAAAMVARSADTLTARGDTLRARVFRGLAEGVRGVRAMADERPAEAIPALERSLDLLAGTTGPEGAYRDLLVWPLADLYATNGREQDALRLYSSFWVGLYAGPALARRAEIHERLGETERARELWTRLLALWKNGDPDHPLMQRARESLGPG